MIKSLTTVRPAANARDFKALTALFDALGFESGTAWNNRQSAGAPFAAPVGYLEFIHTKSGPKIAPDFWVELTGIESAHALAQKAVKTQPSLGAVTSIEKTFWKSRLFHLKTKRWTIAFFERDEPHKQRYQSVEGDLHVSGARFGIVVSRFNAFITDRLLASAIDALRRTGTKEKDIAVVHVPGSFEVPIAARTLAATGRVDAVICLGLLLRGETSNYEHISAEVARGIGQAAQSTGVPCTYGVLTCDTLEQAIDRAGLKMGNKGFEAAITAVEMVSLQGKLKQPRRSRRNTNGKRKKR